MICLCTCKDNFSKITQRANNGLEEPTTKATERKKDYVAKEAARSTSANADDLMAGIIKVAQNGPRPLHARKLSLYFCPI